ncbi:hypothetical protein Tco_1552815, partial [Tanacetum coccineum]
MDDSLEVKFCQICQKVVFTSSKELAKNNLLVHGGAFEVGVSSEKINDGEEVGEKKDGEKMTFDEMKIDDKTIGDENIFVLWAGEVDTLRPCIVVLLDEDGICDPFGTGPVIDCMFGL